MVANRQTLLLVVSRVSSPTRPPVASAVLRGGEEQWVSRDAVDVMQMCMVDDVSEMGR